MAAMTIHTVTAVGEDLPLWPGPGADLEAESSLTLAGSKLAGAVR